MRTKEQFTRAFPQYGYARATSDDARLEIDRLRADEFAHMSGSVYLDHAGATMYSSVQLERVFAELTSAALGNPHSHGSAPGGGESTAARVARVKRQTMRFFRARPDEYELVFTAGATAALKLVGECFPWRGAESTFAHAMDSHTSVLGIRGYAAARGARTTCVSLEAMAAMEQEPAEPASPPEAQDAPDADAPLSLFAFPVECNFSGVRHPLSLVRRVHDGVLDDDAAGQRRRRRWLVLLDAAKAAGTHRLDLSASSPDFVALSFYKMFGYPTGLGALLVRKSALRELRKDYYGGGAVQSILATQHLVVPRGVGVSASDSAGDDGARFADGSPAFLSILSLRHGFDQLETLGMAKIEAHTAALTALLRMRLAALTHWNGAPACELYGRDGHGVVVACNFLRPDGSYVGYAEVGKLAAIHGIQLRTGCFCNPGACQAYLRLADSDLLAGIAAGHVCGDDMDLLDGRPTGAVRLSIGYMTTYEDVSAFTDFAAQYFVSSRAPAAREWAAGPRSSRVRLRKITLFPIKSCSGMAVDAWPVGSRGLLFDREWAIVDAGTSKALSLKELPALCFVHPRVDLKQQTLTISFRRPHGDDGDSGAAASRDAFVLPLSHMDARSLQLGLGKDALDAARDLRVCTDACKGRDVGREVSQWLSEQLGRPCALVRVAANHLRDSQASAPKRRPGSDSSRVEAPTAASASDRPESARSEQRASSKIGFANQAQYLLMSRASVADLNTALRAAGSAEVDEDAFRANLIVDGCAAFEEDGWTRLQVETGGRDDPEAGDSDDGRVEFDVSGPCSRCSMVNVDPKTGAFNRAPLQALARYRRERSSIFFGQFLTRMCSRREATAPPLAWLRVNDVVVAFGGRGDTP
ncbi:hypothetical protein PybrP1_002921 [[Pythium] brassicae (nom. inval.)]|nr:hypothetical protein PybrP1_002921 [[Pythium] brassicae (nom. inval.)]